MKGRSRELVNSDRGWQFTAREFIENPQSCGIAISIGDKKWWRCCSSGEKSTNLNFHRNGTPKMARIDLIRLLTNEIVEIASGNGFDELSPSEHLVSVIVPSHNHEEFIERALESIFQQDYKNIEIILVDDDSSDGTFSVGCTLLRRSQIPFFAIKVKHRGLVPNVNFGIQASYGGWISLLASDDIYYPGKIKNEIDLGSKSHADVVFSLCDQISRDGHLVRKGVFGGDMATLESEGRVQSSLLLQQITLSNLAMLCRRRVYSVVGFYDWQMYTEDFDFSARLSTRDIRRAYLHESVAAHRSTRHGQSLELLNGAKSSYIKVIRQYSSNFSSLISAVSIAFINSAFNKIHYGRIASGMWDLTIGIVLAPTRGCRILLQRISRKAMRYGDVLRR